MPAPASLFDLSGRTAIITGGSRGIGRAIAERLAQHGAKVAVSSRKLAACQEVVDGIVSRGGEAFAVACNIGRKPELQALVDATAERWGGVDVLVCNAAINPHFGPAMTMADEVFDKMMAAVEERTRRHGDAGTGRRGDVIKRLKNQKQEYKIALCSCSCLFGDRLYL